MRIHHTKNKGDLGVLHAQLDLAKRGYAVLLPLTEHEHFDLVVYKDDRFYRVQVKYRAAKDGKIEVGLRSSWADRHGVHSVRLNQGKLEAVCVYCPETNQCYYFAPDDHGMQVALRLEPTRNNQAQGILWAKDFTVFPPRPLSSAG
jgi:hypothetical protein